VPVSSSGLRGVIVNLAEPVGDADGITSLTVEVVDASGAVVATSERSWAGPLEGPLPVPLAAERPSSQITAVRLRWATGGEPVVMEADSRGSPVLTLMSPADDGRRLVFVDDVAVYERLTALGRVRWAANAIVETEAARRVELLRDGLPPNVVLLSEPGPPGSGAAGRIRSVTEPDEDHIEIEVEAEGDGYVVLADALIDGWSAEVDGQPVELRSADHAMVGVNVDAGRHRIVLRYRPFGAPALAVSALSISALAALVLVPWTVERRRRRAQDDSIILPRPI
jgi:hypothetical protein